MKPLACSASAAFRRWGHVGEVVAGVHVARVPLAALAGVGLRERRLTEAGAFVVDEAHGRSLDAFDVGPIGREVGVGAVAETLAGWGGPALVHVVRGLRWVLQVVSFVVLALCPCLDFCAGRGGSVRGERARSRRANACVRRRRRHGSASANRIEPSAVGIRQRFTGPASAGPPPSLSFVVGD